ncbi:MAG: efflux RND transporter periplasmic adaptor subunit [Acidobacteriota bacterium]|nr:efflux RND transporter periplasmic adaptor subunit [Acidobacteriota bacterium]
MDVKDTEALLRAEIEDLKRRLAAHQHPAHEHHGHGHGHGRRKPSAGALLLIAFLLAAAIMAAFLGGYIPHVRRQSELVAEAKSESETAPLVNVTVAERSASKSELVLPGNIQAITEAPILARASGYIKSRLVDIGDRVKEGQLVAEIDAPELNQQVQQAKSAVQQANAALEQANANLVQGRTNEQLYKTTAERWSALVKRGAVSRQDNDTYQAQYQAQVATVQALEKAVNVAQSNVGAAQANLGRLTDMLSYVHVRAPFSGIITQRNVDVGALVNEGSTLLYRIAQTDRLRTFINVPQGDATSVRVGEPARLTFADLGSKAFAGTVTRTANALDPASRTLLVEVQVPNGSGQLLPGMYAQVSLATPRAEPPIVIKGDALVVRSNGPQVAIVQPDKTVHFQVVTLGRDYGDRLEILSGVEPGQQLVINPGDSIQEHVKVRPEVLSAPKK